MDTHTISDPSLRIEDVIGTVSRWPGVSVHDHRFGGKEFRLGTREVGHVHYGGLVDIAFTRTIRDALVGAGLTGDHHVLPNTGWTSRRVRDEADVRASVDLLWLSYLYHAIGLSGRPEGRQALAELDLDAELDRLSPPREVCERFDQVRARAGV